LLKHDEGGDGEGDADEEGEADEEVVAEEEGHEAVEAAEEIFAGGVGGGSAEGEGELAEPAVMIDERLAGFVGEDAGSFFIEPKEPVGVAGESAAGLGVFLEGGEALDGGVFAGDIAGDDGAAETLGAGDGDLVDELEDGDLVDDDLLVGFCLWGGLAAPSPAWGRWGLVESFKEVLFLEGGFHLEGVVIDAGVIDHFAFED